MGEEIVIELPTHEPETENEGGASVAEEIIIDEMAALKELERERITADIIAASALAQAAHDLAQGAHTRIDDHSSSHTVEAEAAAEVIAEVLEAETEPVTEEIEPEPEPEQHEDKKPQRDHWFYR